jgi:hypothetical protein
MGTFLCSALAVALLQAPVGGSGGGAGSDAAAPLRARLARDSGDSDAWFRLGLAYLQVAATYHRHSAPGDSATVRAALDTADLAFARSASLEPSTARGDSARAFRVFAWGERALLVWELAGGDAAARTYSQLPLDARLTPVLEELGENLLRACPGGGVLLTTDPATSYAVEYLRLARGLRTDVAVVPYDLWTTDSVFRARIVGEQRLPRSPPRRGRAVPWIEILAARRPVCASMGFARPPDDGSRVRWTTRPLVWVTGSGATRDQVPPQDFVFAALQLSLQAHDPWARSALTLYRRAAALTPSLCGALATYGVAKEVGCRR